MKEVVPKQLPEVSGGVTDPGGCTQPPSLPPITDFPRMPVVPLTDGPTDPSPTL